MVVYERSNLRTATSVSDRVQCNLQCNLQFQNVADTTSEESIIKQTNEIFLNFSKVTASVSENSKKTSARWSQSLIKL